MAVAVVPTDADHGVGGGRGSVQLEVDVAGAVVGDGDHVDIEQCAGGCVTQQRLLGGRPGVTREQHRSPGPIHAQHQ